MSMHPLWACDPVWRGAFEGKDHGSEVSVIFSTLERVGEGPLLHSHPYSETFIVRDGIVSFILGRKTVEASAGQIVVVPAGLPHRFSSKSDQAEMIDIHASPNFRTVWL